MSICCIISEIQPQVGQNPKFFILHELDMGLQSAYNTDDAMHRYCRQLLALPCLPAELIPDVQDELAAEATTDAQRQLYCARTFAQRGWVQSAVWPPSSSSVFYRAVRLNNDVEGWHRRLNAKASRGSLNLYLLMQMLASESQLVNIQLTLLKESHRIRRQRRASRTTTARLFKLWDRLTSKERTARQILLATSHIFPM